MSNDREYMRVYMAERYRRIRAEIVVRLGGKCRVCGTTETLEIDHINPALKTMGVDRITFVGSERRECELKNCQLLCDKHHNEKSVAEKGQRMARGTHGTLSSARYCKCELCRAAKNAYSRMWKANRKQKNASIAQ